jgi:TolB protein
MLPSWSPNGRQLAFLSNLDGHWNLFVSNLQGGDLEQITSTGNAMNASWSPEGNRLAFEVDTGGNTDVFTYDVPNHAEYQVSGNFLGPDSAPTWDCAGENVSFTSTRSGNPDIYTVMWMGGDASPLTIDPATDKWSEWSPAMEPASRGY